MPMALALVARSLRKAHSLAALVGLIVLAILISPTAADGSRIFLQVGNLTDILRQISLIGIISLSMTFVILTGGIDLSVGSILALSTSLVAMGLTRTWQGAPYARHILLAIAMAVTASALAGTLNGAIVATTRIQPFIVTLAAMIGVRGLAKWLTGRGIRSRLPRKGDRHRSLRSGRGAILGGTGADRVRPLRAGHRR
jgi:ribose/xylose/arabinose/galactoside ABC-type transport system permease subunit